MHLQWIYETETLVLLCKPDTGEIHGWKVCKQRENLGQSFHQQNKMSSEYITEITSKK